MKKTAFLKRRCEKCPPATQTVCRHAFGKFWNDRSNCGEGCDNPLDDVAESWRKAGWTPGKVATEAVTITLPIPTPVSMTQLKMPVRPKVSVKIAKQAELFFRGLK